METPTLTPRPRPAFAQWRYDRNLTTRKTATLLEGIAGYRICSHETVAAICRPFGDRTRSEPWPELIDAIAKLTHERIAENSWRPPLDAEAA